MLLHNRCVTQRIPGHELLKDGVDHDDVDPPEAEGAAANTTGQRIRNYIVKDFFS